VTIHITSAAAGTGRVETMKIEERAPGATVYSTLKDSSVKQANFFHDFKYTLAADAANSVDIRVTVTDDKGQTTQKTVTIPVTGGGALKECNNVTLGAQNNAIGSSFSSSDCSVYTVTDAKNNASKVDIIYFYGATNEATLAAPSDPSFGSGASQIDIGVQDWSVKNATSFRTTTGFDWATATSTSVLAAYNNGTDVGTKANKLQVGDIVAYKTAAGKYGVARVKTIVTGDTGTMMIDTKTTM
jgi:hypothetical protein